MGSLPQNRNQSDSKRHLDIRKKLADSGSPRTEMTVAESSESSEQDEKVERMEQKS